MRWIVLLALCGSASADPLVYVEALGKAGAYGVGGEYSISPRFAVGLEASADKLREQEVATVVPYIHVEPLRRGGNALFGELGVVTSYSKLESSVPRWMGTSTTGVGGVAALGYERSLGKKLVARIAINLLAGKGGAAPWAGIALGWKP